jgi:hypothetical protein
MDELAQARAEQEPLAAMDLAALRELESLRLARTDLERQLRATTHEGRREHIRQALKQVEHQIGRRESAIGQR